MFMGILKTRSLALLTVHIGFCLFPAVILASDSRLPDIAAAEYVPDPAAVERFGPAWKYPRAGWIVVHIEGTPYERGYQHGRLLAAEIVDLIDTLSTSRGKNGPAEAWKQYRLVVQAFFLRRYEA